MSRVQSIDSSDDEMQYVHAGGGEQRWWLTRVLVGALSSVATGTAGAYRRLVGPSHRYPYTDRRPAKGTLFDILMI